MTTHVTPVHLIPILLPIVVALLLYRRIRRNVGQQVFKLRRVIGSLVFLSVLTLLIAALSRNHPSLLVGLGVGILVGVPLGLAGRHLTHFETTDEGLCFKPNTYIGVGISLLLAGRVAYRLTLFHATSPNMGHRVPGLLKSPLTLFILGILAGYYLVYHSSLLVSYRRMNPDNEGA